jgi:hypothetical protein
MITHKNETHQSASNSQSSDREITKAAIELLTPDKQSQQDLRDSLENPSQQSERKEVITWLIQKGLPPLPVAPAQDPYKYPLKNKKGEIQYSKEPGVPKGKFTGKNPSYLKNGIPHLISHRDFQDKLPTEEQVKMWFADPSVGVGTLGGWNNIIWLDFDVKQFASQDECDAAAEFRIADIRSLSNQMPFTERTHSGGWRVGVQVKQEPNFTNFSLTPGGHHVGEALGKGRFTVLAPTIGTSGKPYSSSGSSIRHR